MKRLVLLLTLICLTISISYAQFGYGVTAKTGLYQRFSNPQDDIASNSAGSALLNIGLGPKIWVGGERVSISAEASAMIAPFAISTGDFKGMGAASFPVMAKINFGGLVGVNKQGTLGLSIGGGFQWSRTELFGLTSKFETLGVERSLFKTFIGEIAAGFGMSGFAGYVYLRYGKNNELNARTFNLGIGYDFNVPTLKVLTDPDF